MLVAMSIKNKIIDVIRKHKNGISFLLGIRPSEFYAEDIQVMANYLTYKAGTHHSVNKGAADKSFLDAIHQLPAEKKCEAVLIEACAWKESGELRSKSLVDALNAPPMFSPRVEAALENRRLKTYRKEGKQMAVKTALLADQMQKIEAMISPDANPRRSFSDPEFRRELRAETKKLGHMFTGMNYHLKGVMLYAVKSGYTPEDAGHEIHSVYLKRVKRIISSLSAVDDLLTINGMTSNLSKRAKNEYKKWSDLIDDCTTAKKEANDEQLQA